MTTAPRNLQDLLSLAGLIPAEPITRTTETVGAVVQTLAGQARTVQSAYLHIDDRDTLSIPARIRDMRDRHMLPVEMRCVSASSRIVERVDGHLVETDRVRPNIYVIEWRGNLRRR